MADVVTEVAKDGQRANSMGALPSQRELSIAAEKY